ncbi:hypothetical protein CHS0354_008346 [Potamilus streckersoni]|uniref:Uncharacterized protein n=1 Tax=Potamilus streckersoni TaxID=2493646 RepID=A0AAE0SCC7_9BIVA|nr:hypothetical protein CHS0354_008346 [Potamilus streckersoni]
MLLKIEKHLEKTHFNANHADLLSKIALEFPGIKVFSTSQNCALLKYKIVLYYNTKLCFITIQNCADQLLAMAYWKQDITSPSITPPSFTPPSGILPRLPLPH